MLKLLKNRNFFTFWIGDFISVIGDHISLIAFPWLILQMTGSAFMTGMVLAVQGLPRALLMLPGGALVDRTSPRSVMLWTNFIRFCLVLTLAWLISHDAVDITGVFVLALAFGIADAFFYPASTAILPSLVKKDQLQAGNAIIQMTIHLSIIIGPVVAGLLIAGSFETSGHDAVDITSSYEKDRQGLARAFYVDAATFAFGFITLLFTRVRSLHDSLKEGATSMWQEIKIAIVFVWSIPAVRIAFIGVATFHLLYQAPVLVGLPVLAKERFAEGALVYGLEMGAYGGGAFIGGLAGGMMRGFNELKLVKYMFLIFAYSAATLGMVVLYEPYEWAMFVFFSAGLGDGMVWVLFIVWVQRLTPEHLLGRVMGLFMFMSIGLLPIANIIMGIIAEIEIEISLLAISALMTIICLICAFHPDGKRLEISEKYKEL